MAFLLDDLKKWYQQYNQHVQDDYFSFLKIPSISTDPAFKKEVFKAAVWVETYLKNIGFQTQLWKTDIHPIVFASYETNPSFPTVLIYHHYDVQPPDPLEKWISPPFQPQVRDRIVYARGASDNKGQCVATLAALKAFFALDKKPRLNIKLFIEGEEENGSASAFKILSKKQQELKADYALIVDSGFHTMDKPVITLGLRGLTTLEVTCRNSSVDLHSGLYGGLALNPNRALICMLAKLWDEEGHIQVPGFYDNLSPITQEILQEFDQTVDKPYFTNQIGIKAFHQEKGYTEWETNTIRPTLEINGICGGYTGPGFKTVIPSTASAKISCRLVPHQNPEVIAHRIGDYLKKIAPKGLEVINTFLHGGESFQVLPQEKICQICTEAYTEVFNKSCQKIFCGASIPLVAKLSEVSQASTAIIGVALGSDDMHAPNEHFSLEQLEKGVLTMGNVLRRLSQW